MIANEIRIIKQNPQREYLKFERTIHVISLSKLVDSATLLICTGLFIVPKAVAIAIAPIAGGDRLKSESVGSIKARTLAMTAPVGMAIR